MDYGLRFKHYLLPLLCIPMVLGNGSLIYVILRHKHLRTVTNCFILGLACSDLCMGAVALPLLVVVEEGVFGRSLTACLVVVCVAITQLLVSCLILMAIAAERYIAILHPLKHHSMLNTRNAVLVIAFCWLYGLVIGSLPLFGWNALPDEPKTNITTSSEQGTEMTLANTSMYFKQETAAQNWTSSNNSNPSEVPQLVCTYQTVISGSYSCFMYPSHFVLLWVVLICLYTRVYLKTRQHGAKCNVRRLSNHQQQQQGCGSARRARENWRALRILGVLVGYFLFSWLGMVVWYSMVYRGFRVERAANLESPLPDWFYIMSLVLAFGNSAVNPFLYGLGLRSVRKAWLQLLVCRNSGPTQNRSRNGNPSKLSTHNMSS